MGLVTAVNTLLLAVGPVFFLSRLWALPTFVLVGCSVLGAVAEVAQAALPLPLGLQDAAVPPALLAAALAVPALRKMPFLGGGGVVDSENRPRALAMGAAMGSSLVHLTARVLGALGTPGFSWDAVVLAALFNVALLKAFSIVALVDNGLRRGQVGVAVAVAVAVGAHFAGRAAAAAAGDAVAGLPPVFAEAAPRCVEAVALFVAGRVL